MKNIINTTPHSIRFWSPAWEEPKIVEPCGIIINAAVKETEVKSHIEGVTLVKTEFVASKASEEALEKLEKENPGAVTVGSIIAAQAFPGRVFALCPAPGYERVAPAEKRMLPDKFTIY